jgi:hypothetical protein
MPHQVLEDLLEKSRVTEVYFGGEGFRIYTPAELEEGQRGYSIHPDGTDLTGQGEVMLP